jgi:hypothetical protein
MGLLPFLTDYISLLTAFEALYINQTDILTSKYMPNGVGITIDMYIPNRKRI